MTTTPRLSPSGKKLGPIHYGPGTTTRKWRAKGVGDSVITLVDGVTSPISGLDDIVIDMRPGYLYEVDLYTTFEITASTSTTLTLAAVVARRPTGGAYGTWAAMPGAPHLAPLTTTNVNEFRQFCNGDLKFGDPVTSPFDGVKFGILAAADVGTTKLVCGQCHVVISEYLAP